MFTLIFSAAGPHSNSQYNSRLAKKKKNRVGGVGGTIDTPVHRIRVFTEKADFKRNTVTDFQTICTRLIK